MPSLNLRTLSDDEKERLYYQAGMPEVAAIYAQVADVQAENDEYEEQVEKMVGSDKYNSLEKLVEHLQDHIRNADKQLSALHDFISDAPKLTRKALLAMLTDVVLDPDSEP